MLPSDSIGTAWRTLANFSDGAAPTLLESDFGVGELRERRFERLVAAAQVVVIGVGNARGVRLIVALVVLGDLGAEARVLGARQREVLGRLRLLRHGPKASAGPRAEKGAA